LPIEPAPNSSDPLIAWREIARTCRRVCLLRERGEHEEAERVRTGPLAALVSAARTPTDTDAGMALRLESLWAQETERVANAAVLAELLRNLLPEPPRSPASPSRATAGAAATPKLSSVPSKPRAVPASIADFIDTMLEQDDPAGSSSPAPARHGP
jgi:hypothetical protein